MLAQLKDLEGLSLLHATCPTGMATFAKINQMLHSVWHMLTYADVCSRQIQPDAALGVAMLTSAGVCWRMLTYADVC